MKDFYYILGTERNCTPGELNSAYRKLAEKFSNSDSDHFLQSHFNEITEAYQVLSDPLRRRKYDVAFKKHYQRRLYYFKIRHLNVAVTLTLILITGLFGWYVANLLKGKPQQAPPPVQTIAANAAPGPVVKHHKKKHNLFAQSVRERFTPKTKSAPIIPSKQVDTTKYTQRTTVKSTPAVPEIKPVINQSTNSVGQTEDVTSAFLQANTTGVVALYQTAGYTSAIIANIPNQAKIKVLDHGSAFCKIAYNGQIGYVPKRTVVEPF